MIQCYPTHIQEKLDELAKAASEAMARVPKPYESKWIQPSFMERMRHHEAKMAAAKPYQDAMKKLIEGAPLKAMVLNKMPEGIDFALVGENSIAVMTNDGTIKWSENDKD